MMMNGKHLVVCVLAASALAAGAFAQSKPHITVRICFPPSLFFPFLPPLFPLFPSLPNPAIF
jgi:DNA-binding transcriptional LysR family regulator